MSGELCYAYGSGALAYKSGDGRLIYKSAGKEFVRIAVDATFEPKSEDFYPDAYVVNGFTTSSALDGSQLGDKKTEWTNDAEGYPYRCVISFNVRRGGNFTVNWMSFWVYQSHSSTVTVAFTLDGRDAGGFTAASGESTQSRTFQISDDGKSIVSP